MARLNDITFESGSLTGTNGADSAQGAISLDSGSAMKGTYSGHATAAGDFIRDDNTAADSYYCTMLIKFASLPASSQSRVLFFRAGTVIQCTLRVTSAGKVQLRDSSNAQVGSDSSTTLSTNTIYRLGLRYTKGAGSDAILEGFVAADGVAFGSAFASTSSATNTSQIDRVEAGCGAGGTAADIYIDNIRIDNASMPTDDVSGGTTYNQSVNVTETPTFSMVKQTSKPLSFTTVSVFTVIKQTAHPISATVGNSFSMIKQVNKPLLFTASSTVSDILKQVGTTINATVNSTVSIIKAINKTLDFSTAANVAITAGLLIYKTIDVTASTSVQLVKTVNKTISVTVQSAFEMLRSATIFVLTMGRNIAAFDMKLKDTGTTSMSNSDDQIIIIDPTDETTI